MKSLALAYPLQSRKVTKDPQRRYYVRASLAEHTLRCYPEDLNIHAVVRYTTPDLRVVLILCRTHSTHDTSPQINMFNRILVVSYYRLEIPCSFPRLVCVVLRFKIMYVTCCPYHLTSSLLFTTNYSCPSSVTPDLIAVKCKDQELTAYLIISQCDTHFDN